LKEKNPHLFFHSFSEDMVERVVWARALVFLAATVMIGVMVGLQIGLYAPIVAHSRGNTLSSRQYCSNPCLIVISNGGFNGGRPVFVHRGALVSWVNEDPSLHTATSVSGLWDTGIINPGKTSHLIVFANDGTFDYYCAVSLSKATIVVTG